MPSARIPMTGWTPDVAPLGTGEREARNVTPVPDGYAPVRELLPLAPALDGAVVGATGPRIQDESATVYASTLDKVYAVTRTAATLVHTYATPLVAGSRVRFAPFGELIFSVNGSTRPIYTNPPTTPWTVLGSPAPEGARCICTVREFVVVGGMTGARQRVHWSAQGDGTSWPTIGSDAAVQVQSDAQDLFGPHGNIQQIVSGISGADALVFSERAVHRMQYVGAPVVFGFDLFEGARGCPAPDSVTVAGGVAYYLSEDGWAATDGSSIRPIGVNRIDRWFSDHVDKSRLEEIIGVADPTRQVIVWAIPLNGGPDGVLNGLLFYNYVLDRWSWSDGNSLEWLLQSFNFQFNLDDLGSLNMDDPANNFNMDSRVGIAETAVLGAFDTAHQYCTFTGPTLPAVIETAEQGDEAAALFLREVWPLVDSSAALVTTGWRNRQADSVVWGGPQAVNQVGFCRPLRRARYHRVRIEVPGGKQWNLAQGLNVVVHPTGMRR